MRTSTGFEPARVFVDTWGWLALLDAGEAAHGDVASLRRQAAEGVLAWVTSDYVLDETITRLFARRHFSEARRALEGVFEAERQGTVTIETITRDRFQHAWRLRLRYRDKPRISFTDFTSFVVMRDLGIRDVITANGHFAQIEFKFRLLPASPVTPRSRD